MSVYQSLFDLVQQYIFGGGTLNANAELVCMLVSTIGSVFLIAVPFMVVWKVIKLIMG